MKIGMRMRFAILVTPALIALLACDDGTIHVVRFPDGKIREMWTEKGPQGRPTVRDGEYQSFYPDGRRESVVPYRQGKRDGRARTWDGQGRLAAERE